MTHHTPPPQRRSVGKFLNSCQGKKVYLSMKHAENDAEALRRRSSHAFAAYPCPFRHELGPHWHVGHGDDIARHHKVEWKRQRSEELSK